MEIILAKKDLLRLVARMQGVAERKSTMPILASVQLSTQGDDLVRLAATDMYLSLSGVVPAQVKKPGSVAVPAKDLFERIKMMPDGPLSLSSADGAQTVIKAVGSARRYTLRGSPGTDFPQLPVPAENAAKVELAIDVLRELIAKTFFSISGDESRAHLNSALFEWEGTKVRMVTTDGHRLSKMEAGGVAEANFAMLVPQKAILELRGLCEEMVQDADKGAGTSPTLTIQQSGPNAFFRAGTTTFGVKLVDAQFPPYAQVIPQATDKIVTAPRLDLASSLRAVSIAASDRSGGVKVAVGGGKLRITSESPDAGDGFDELVVDYDGPELTIGFNAKYFLDVLAALDDNEVELALSRELDPVVIRPKKDKSNADRDFLAVVMPMRI